MKPLDLSRDNAIKRKVVALSGDMGFATIDNAESNACLELFRAVGCYCPDNSLHTKDTGDRNTHGEKNR